MAFWIKNNVNATKNWKLTNNIFYISWVVIFLLRIIIRMIDKANNTVSDLQNLLTWIGFVFIFFYLIINIIHWLKPQWFES